MPSHKRKRQLSLLILLIALPIYAAAVLWILSMFERPPVWAELLLYAAAGVAWAIPLRRVFLGVGQAAPPNEGAER